VRQDFNLQTPRPKWPKRADPPVPYLVEEPEPALPERSRAWLYFLVIGILTASAFVSGFTIGYSLRALRWVAQHLGAEP
jgi:hypothetical protein